MASTPDVGGTFAPVPSGAAGPRLSASVGLLAGYAALCALSLLPFLLIEHPPIVDFANHVARLSLACSAGDPAVDAMYRYDLGIIPNLAADLVNLPLCGIVSPAGVLKGVTAGSLLLIYFSGWWIQRKLFGSPNFFLLLLPAFAMNLVTSMGYINFLAGAAVACLMVAVAIGRERKFSELLVIGNIGGIILFFCHIFALALAMVLFFGIVLSGMPRNARGIIVAGLKTSALFVVPLLLIPMVPSGFEGLKIDYVGKVRVLVALFMAQHPNPSIFGVFFFVPLYLAMRKGWVKIHASLWLPLGSLAAFVLLVPSGLQDAVDVDGRTFVVLAYLVFASLQPLHHKREITAVVIASSASLVAYALLMTVLVWVPFSREVAEFRKSLRVLPARALVISVVDKDGRTTASSFAYGHLTSYATLDRRIFNPLDFTGVGMQPLMPTPAFAPFDTPAAMPFNASAARRAANPDPALEAEMLQFNVGYARRWPERFDYVIFYHFGRRENFDPSILTVVERGSFYSILKINKPRP